jgi:heme-degrading monooxygenase HmoA
MLAGASVAAGMGAETKRPIQLHVDLSVDAAKEQEMLHNFKQIFLPAAKKQPGYIDVKMLKLRSVLQGNMPAKVNYRFVLTYASEEQRKQWVETATHKRVWPTVENQLASKDYTVVLFDET